jgi:hypothetical protein
MNEAIISSETSVLTRATRRQNPEDGILHIHHRQSLISYIVIDIFDACWLLAVTSRIAVTLEAISLTPR